MSYIVIGRLQKEKYLAYKDMIIPNQDSFDINICFTEYELTAIIKIAEDMSYEKVVTICQMQRILSRTILVNFQDYKIGCSPLKRLLRTPIGQCTRDIWS